MKRALGIDHGEARIGIAISDELGAFAHPRETIDARKGKPLDRVLEIIVRERIGIVILGLPRHMNGSEGAAAQKTRAFAEQLRARLGEGGCEVRLMDERLTTVAAQKALHASGRNVKNSRPIIDQVAAQILLQTYLDGERFKLQEPGFNAADEER